MTALHHPPRDTFHPLRDFEIIGRQITGDKVHFFFEALCLDQFLVIGMVVIEHGHRIAMLVPENQHTVAIQRPHPLWPHHGIQTTFPGPFESGLEKSASCFLIIFTIEEVKISLFRFVILIEWLVFNRGNPPHILPIAHSQEKIHIRVLMKRVLLAVEVSVSIHVQQRHPLRTIFVQLVRELDEAFHLGFVFGINFLDGEHEILLS